MAFSDGDDFVTGSLLSFQQANRMKNNFSQASEPSGLQQGMNWADSDDDKFYLMGTSATEEILQLTRSKDVDPWFNAPEFKALNIVTSGGAAVVSSGAVVFHTDNF